MARLAGPLLLIRARGRRRPSRWLLPALGIACAAAFAGVIVAEATITADRSARRILSQTAPLDRTVRVSWSGVVTAAVEQQARGLLRIAGLGAPTEVVLMQPVRLGQTLVRPAAIAPLARWVGPRAAAAVARCRPSDCPMLLAGAGHVPATLTTYGVRIRIVGSVPLRSAVPLGFAPASGGGPPVLLTGDLAGLDELSGLSGLFRTRTWLAPLDTAAAHSWQLDVRASGLLRAQAKLLSASGQFAVTLPFTALQAASAEAHAAPRRLLLTGGGALAALVFFVVLAAAGLRTDQRAELDRLDAAGARTGQAVAFLVGEAAWLAAAALLVGALTAVILALVLARIAGEPGGAVLAHSLLTPDGALALLAGWLIATMVLAVSPLIRGHRLADALAVAAPAALAAGLAFGAGGDGGIAVLLAPLCCLAAGIVIYRVVGPALRVAERGSRRGPVLVRLALVGLARAPTLPALAVAFLAVSVGLGGFAIAYRATLLRGAADQAADRVPLDALLAPGANFQSPLDLASVARWRALSGGTVLPVRRTDATYTGTGAAVAVPALGIPAGRLTLLHGWRVSDGSAPLSVLAGRLEPSGLERRPGPTLPAGTAVLSLTARSPGLRLTATADLRDRSGAIARVTLGTIPAQRTVLRARIPPGRWELEALELAESSGLEITSGHQNGENPAAATQSTARLALGPVTFTGAGGRTLGTVTLAGWRGVGAASTGGMSVLPVSFQTGGAVGVVRPAQPTAPEPVPILADPATAAAADAAHRLALTVDGLPVQVRIVGIVKRFPTVPADAAGVIVADASILDGALDAQLPGQGRPDELWLARAGPGLRAALRARPLSALSASFRNDVERALRTAPLARGELGVLVAAAVLSLALAVLGLLLALLASFRDVGVERDLEAQGVGPHTLRTELRLRLGIAALAGVLLGIVLALVLTRFAVGAVRAAGSASTPEPPLVTVVPVVELAAWALVVLALRGVATLGATHRVGRGPARSPARRHPPRPSPRTATP